MYVFDLDLIYFLLDMMGVAAGGEGEGAGDAPNELWEIYKKEREHREHVKEWIAGTINFARNNIPYCHLSKNMLDIQPSKGITTAQAVYISTMAMSLDQNRERAVALVNAFLEYSSDYKETLEFLLKNTKRVVVEEEPFPTQIERLRQDVVELVNGVKMDVAEHRANIDQLYLEVFKDDPDEEQTTTTKEEELALKPLERFKKKQKKVSERLEKMEEENGNSLKWKVTSEHEGRIEFLEAQLKVLNDKFNTMHTENEKSSKRIDDDYRFRISTSCARMQAFETKLSELVERIDKISETVAVNHRD